MIYLARPHFDWSHGVCGKAENSISVDVPYAWHASFSLSLPPNPTEILLETVRFKIEDFSDVLI